MKSLKLKMILLMGALLIVSLLGTFAISFFSSTDFLQESITQGSHYQAENLSLNIDSFIEEKIAIAGVIANYITGDQKQDLPFLDSALSSYSFFQNILISYDLSGTRIMYIDGSTRDLSHMPHYQEASKGEGRVIVAEPSVSAQLGNDVLTILSPLMKNGSQYGYIGVVMPIQEIQQTVSAEVFGDTGFAYLTSREGQYIWSPDEEKILEQRIVDAENQELLKAFESIQNGEAGAITYRENGSEMFTAFAPTKYGWGVFLTAPSEELLAPVKTLSSRIIAVSIAMLIIGILLVYVLANTLTKPINRLNQGVKVVAEGDLSTLVEVRGKDEIAVLTQDFNQTVTNLKELISGVSISSEKVLSLSDNVSSRMENATATITQMNQSIQQIAEGSQLQANSSKEVSKSMEEMAAGIVRMAESSSSASEAANEAAQQADSGNLVVDQAVIQMNQISEGTSNAATAIEQLQKRSKEIETILVTISDISAQINLLSLNASIEAARAGEHGRGFAVVAEEVKQLANQSAQSTDLIANLIREIQQDTYHAVEVMQGSKKDVNEGIQLIQEVKDRFDQILVASKNLAEHVMEISAGTEEMSAGSEEVSASAEEMHRIAQHSSEDSTTVAQATSDQLIVFQEIAGTVEELNKVVQELQTGVEKFKV